MSQGIEDKDLASSTSSIFESLVRLHTLGDIVTYANKGLLLQREDEDEQDKFVERVMSFVHPECETDECWHDHDCLQPPWPACHKGEEADKQLAKALLPFCPWTSGARRECECAKIPGDLKDDDWPQIVRERLWGWGRAGKYVERQGVDPHSLDKSSLSRLFAAEYLAADRHSAYVDESAEYLGSEERGRSLAHMGRVFQHLLAKTPLDWRTIEGLVWMISEYSHGHLKIDPRLDIAAHLLQAARNEPALHAMRDFYRDHFMHAIEVCFLGHLLLITHDQNGKPLWRHVAEQPGVVQEPGEWREELEPGADRGGITLKHVLRQWYVAALLHDVGYAIDIFRALQEMLEFYSHPKEMVSFRESLEDALEALSASGEMEDMARVLGLKNPDNLGRDHGVIAATHLRSLLQQLERDKDPGSYSPAIRAIGVHNDRRASVDFETDPLGVLLILCDTIQEWGRPNLRYATAPSMLLARLLAMDGDREDITGPLRTTSLNVTRSSEPNARPEFQLDDDDDDSLMVRLAYDEGIQDNAGVFNLWIDASCNLQRLIPDSFPFNVKIELKTPCFRVLGRDPQSQMSRLRDAAAETHMHFLHDWLPSSPDGSNVTGAVRHSLEKISEFMFSVGLGYQGHLEAGELSKAFRQEFESNGITLSHDLTIETQVEHDKWRIKENDSGRTYIVRRQDEALNVYISDFGFDTLTLDLRRLAEKKVIAGDVDRFRDRLKGWKRSNEDRDFEGDYSPLLPGR